MSWKCEEKFDVVDEGCPRVELPGEVVVPLPESDGPVCGRKMLPLVIPNGRLLE